DDRGAETGRAGDVGSSRTRPRSDGSGDDDLGVGGPDGPGGDDDDAVISRLLREQSGQALVVGLMTMAVLATLTTAVTLEVTVNHRSAGRSADANKAFAIAQLGLSYAEGRVYAAAAAHTTPATGATSFSQDGGTGTYSASVAADGISWTMTATAAYQGITKTVSAQANVPSPITVNDGNVWNYLYADS